MAEKKVLLKDLFEEAKKKNKIQKSKISKKRAKEEDTGFLRTRKVYCQSCTKKFTYRYKYFDEKRKKNRVITCVDFVCLKDKIKNKGLSWGVDNYGRARKTAKEIGLPLKDLK